MEEPMKNETSSSSMSVSAWLQKSVNPHRLNKLIQFSFIYIPPNQDNSLLYVLWLVRQRPYNDTDVNPAISCSL